MRNDEGGDDDDHHHHVGSHRQAAGDYAPGSIKRITVKNFLTYSDATIRPGARLNMVVGANGTGKSSVLNAICLGLGGEPKLLGRAVDVRDYVKHGETKAMIEIELAPKRQPHDNDGAPPVVHVIRRVIDQTKGSEKGHGRGSSVFTINGEKASAKDVLSLVKEEYNISIANMCTFLPQDKVGAFSSISPQDLLLETEKTLSGDLNFYEVHQELIQAELELGDSGEDVTALQSKLKQLQHENEQLERQKEMLEEREAALAQADLLSKKKLWLEHDALQQRALELKKQKAEMKKRLIAAQTELQPLEDRRNAVVSHKKLLDAKFKEQDEETKRYMAGMEKQCKKYETHDDQIESIMVELSEIDTRRSSYEAEVRKCQERVDALEEQMKQIPSKEKVTADYKEALQKFKAKHQEYTAAKKEVQQLNQRLRSLEERAGAAQQKVVRLNDDAKLRKDRIFRQQPNLAKIFNWLEQNRAKFRRRVTGPLACEITAKSAQAAACLEHNISNNILKAFVVETKEDYDLLYNSVRNGLKIPINVIRVDQGRLKPANRPYSDRKMEIMKNDFGVEGYLDDSLTCPDQVRQALQDYAGIHKILVGSEKTFRNSTKFADYASQPDASLNQTEPKGFVFVGSSNQRLFQITGVVSRYSKQITERQDEISPAKMLAQGIDTELQRQAEDELNALHEEMNSFRPLLQAAEQKNEELEGETQRLRVDQENGKNCLDTIQKLQDKMNNATRKLQEANAKLEIDDTGEKKTLIESLKNRISHSITALEVHSAQHRKVLEATIANAGVEANRSALAAEVRAAEHALEEMRKSTQDLETEAEAVRHDFNKSKSDFVRKREEAMKEAPIFDCENNPLPLKAELEALSVNTIYEVEAAIAEATELADGIVANPDAIRMYEERKAEIERIETQLEDLTNAKAMKADNLAAKRRGWEDGLQQKLMTVNSLFTKYMAEMGNTGEIVLHRGKVDDEGDETGDFKNWGIRIMVSFRENTGSHQLSAHRHSGGERSVSTIMYLMALQGLMQSPFRCVDEINQGLDERNERLVFRRIVENSCGKPVRGPMDHSGQYFLITPKLLPNLYDMENQATTILFVFNGPFNFKHPNDWDIELILGLKKRPRIAASDKEETEEFNDENNGGNSVCKSRKKSRQLSNEK